VFLPNRTSQPSNVKNNRDSLNEEQPHLFQYLGRSFVDVPLNSPSTEQRVYESEIKLSPNPNSSKLINHSQNTQFEIYLQSESVQVLQFVISRNVPAPIYLESAFISNCDPSVIRVSNSAKRILFEENAGGCSEFSEAFSFELLRQCFGAKLLKTEMDIRYWSSHWKKTDYLVTMQGVKIGVSVTRAMKFRGIFTEKDATKLLRKKLNGVNESTVGVFGRDAWQRQILHIWTTDEYIEEILHKTYLKMLLSEPELVSNTVVIVTVASEDCYWLFYQSEYFKNQRKSL